MTAPHAIDPALVQRMVELVKRLHAGLVPGERIVLGKTLSSEDNAINAELHAIASLLTKPVDPAVLACREVVAKTEYYHWPAGAEQCRAGDFDKCRAMQIALAAYAAGASSTKSEVSDAE